MKLTLDTKILAGFVACAITVVVIAVISFRKSEEFLESNDRVNHSHEVLDAFDQVLIGAVEAETGARGYLLTGEEDFLQPFTDAKAGLTNEIMRARELTAATPELTVNVDQLERLSANHIRHLDSCISLRDTDLAAAERLVISGDTRRILNQIRKVINDSREAEVARLERRAQTSQENADTFNVQFLILIAVIVGILCVVYVIIRVNLNALRRAESEAQKKNATLSASSELVETMQGNKTLAELGDAILSHFAKYLNIQLGALYIADGNTLRKVGGYADGKAVGQQGAETITFGEGTVGQCAQDRQPILLQDIEPRYFNIATSFGQIRPKSILAIPAIYEDKIAGVIQLGTIQTFTAEQREYLELVSNNIAIALVSARMRQEVAELLEETQRQSEELESQQIELKQTNEELQAQTELLERSEAELRAQQADLQQVNVELEEKANQLEQQKRAVEKARDEVELKSRELELTSQYKSEFLANMSHELRTPLNSILILSQLLSENKNQTLGKKDVEYARNIHKAGADLLELINEILDLSRVEAGKLQLDIEETTVKEIVDNLTPLFEEVANSRGIAFKIEGAKKLQSQRITTDSQRVEQILKNLLSNAFKFTRERGTVTLQISKSEDDSHLAFTVRDNGIGIPPDKLELIFEAFQQADGSTKRKYGGTGLGLSISRELSLALGGHLTVTSEEGQGSAFTLHLPWDFNAPVESGIGKQVEVRLRTPTPPSSATPANTSTVLQSGIVPDDRNTIGDRDKVIIIVEDDPSFANVLLDIVRERDYKGIVVTEGPSVLGFVRHYRPTAIFLDIHLPVMDGIEVLRQIKSDPALRHIPVQIISAYDERRKGLAMGAFDYIKKPVSAARLNEAFDRIESFRDKKLKRLLIVEDNKQQNDAIRELIGNGDVKCFSAYKGQEAYEMLGRDHFDCLIVDLGLPDMSGLELLEKIKANERLNRIPVIVYTARDLKADEISVLNKLADTVVLKTASSKERLFDEAMLFLHRVEERLPREKQKLVRQLLHTEDILKGKRVLLVDDDIRNVYSLSNVLEEEGVTCVVAENGRQAVDILTNDSNVDLVLMDLMMPEMDGYEATAEIRKMEHLKKLPIIALTAKAMKGDKEKCLSAGMSDYISKPVDIDQLLSLMRVWLYSQAS